MLYEIRENVLIYINNVVALELENHKIIFVMGIVSESKEFTSSTEAKREFERIKKQHNAIWMNYPEIKGGINE